MSSREILIIPFLTNKTNDSKLLKNNWFLNYHFVNNIDLMTSFLSFHVSSSLVPNEVRYCDNKYQNDIHLINPLCYIGTDDKQRQC